MFEQVTILLGFVYAIALTHLLSSANELVLDVSAWAYAAPEQWEKLSKNSRAARISSFAGRDCFPFIADIFHQGADQHDKNGVGSQARYRLRPSLLAAAISAASKR